MTAYKVRSLRKDELEGMLTLTSRAYNAPVEVFRRIYQNDPFYDFSLTRVAEKDGRLISYLRAAPRTIWMGPSTLRMGGIAEVCTLQEYRGMGIATQLLKDMIRLLVRKGYPVSMLYGRDTFYRRVGYERCSIVSWLRVPPGCLPRSRGSCKVRDYSEDDLEEVMACYDRTYRGRSCAMLRDPIHWRVRILGRSTVRVYDSGGVKGYLCSNIREEKVEEGARRVLVVEEAGFRSFSALVGLVGDLANSQQCEMVAYVGHRGDRVLSALAVPGASLSVGWSGMFRVNDVLATLDSLKGYFSRVRAKLALRIRDDVVEANSDTFIIEGDGEEATVTRGKPVPGCESLDLDIRELSQMVPGSLPVAELASQGRVGCSSRSALKLADKLFPYRGPFQPSLDHF